MECNFCKKSLSTKSALKVHQNKVKYCLIIQGKIGIKGNYICSLCGKDYQTKAHLNNHSNICEKNSPNIKLLLQQNQNINLENIMLKKENEMLKIELDKLRLDYKELSTTVISRSSDDEHVPGVDNFKYEISILKNIITELRVDNKELKNQYGNLCLQQRKNKDNRIQYLTKKYVKAQPRVQYAEKNVIYILTTKLMKKERRYILGKATNLTNRLSTYNKSDEHEVVYHKGCKDEETMSCVENMVFKQLEDYREQANRERFILPEEEEIELFSNKIKNSIEFFSK